MNILCEAKWFWHGADDDEMRKKQLKQARRKRWLLVAVFCVFAIILVGAVMICSANEQTLSLLSCFPRGLFGNAPQDCDRATKVLMSVATDSSQDILTKPSWDPYVDHGGTKRTYTPRALHLRETAPMLDQGKNGTCLLAAFARTVARIS